MYTPEQIADYWKILKGETTLIEATAILENPLTEEQVGHINFPYHIWFLNVVNAAYLKLVEAGEIDPNIIYNFASKSQDPSDFRENDYGACGEKRYCLVNGNWREI